jgi:hypothetical protein
MKILLILLGLIGASSDKSFDGTSMIVNKVIKVTKTHKVSFSPHQKLFHMTMTNRNFILLQDTTLGVIKLYESKSIHGLLSDHRDTPSLTNNDWEHCQRLLIREPLDA